MLKEKYFKNRFVNCILSLDAMGPSIALNFDGNENYRTSLGTFFTFVTLIISLFTISSSLEDVFYKSNPNVYSSSSYDDQPLLLNNTNFKFYITILNFDLTTFTFSPISKSEFKLTPVYNNVKANTSGYFMLSNALDLADCDNHATFKDYNSGFVSEKAYKSSEVIESIRKNAYCLPDISYTIGSNSQEQTLFNIGFVSGLFKPAFEKYPYIAIQFTYRSVMVNPDNFTNYYNEVWTDHYFLPKQNQMTFHQLNIEKYLLKKDQTTFIFADELNKDLINGAEIYEIATVDKLVNEQSSLLSISFNKNNMSTKMNIKYKSFNDVISDFGGSFGALFPFFQVILKLVVFKVYNYMVLDHVIKLYEPNDEHYKVHFKNFILQGKQEKLNNITKIEPHNEPLKNDSEQNPELKMNRFIDSFDKQSDVFIYKQSETREDFLKTSVKTISMNKFIPIKSYLKMGFNCGGNEKKTQNLRKLLEKSKVVMKDTLNIASMFNFRIMFKKIIHILFSNEERQILSNTNLGVNNCKFNEKENVSPERQIRYLMELNYKERKSRKLLKGFINGNF
jgi:hypothetical protein